MTAWRAFALALAVAPLATLTPAWGDEPRYQLSWSFPADDDSAIEIDDANLRASPYETQARFVKAAQRCDLKLQRKVLREREAGVGTPLREVRIVRPDGPETRCVQPLTVWRKRLGARLVDRLEDELDAKMSFIAPRRFPGGPRPRDGGAPP